jgi:Zn-dependent peptidase ImmA (M78 family)
MSNTSLHGKTFRVGGIDYSVEIVPKLYEKHSLYGQVTYKDAHIQIDDSLSKNRENEVLVHELLHAMLFEAGYMEQDEELVNRLASVLHQVLRDNDFSFVRGEADE